MSRRKSDLRRSCSQFYVAGMICRQVTHIVIKSRSICRCVLGTFALNFGFAHNNDIGRRKFTQGNYAEYSHSTMAIL